MADERVPEQLDRIRLALRLPPDADDYLLAVRMGARYEQLMLWLNGASIPRVAFAEVAARTGESIDWLACKPDAVQLLQPTS